MNACREFEPLLSLFAGNELNAEQSVEVAAHLTICSACREKLAGFKTVLKDLSTLAAPSIPAADFAGFYEGVLSKIEHVEMAQKRTLGLTAILQELRRRRRSVLAVATFVMIVVVPMVLTHYFHSPPPSSSNLAQLLLNRDWMGLYYVMLDNNLRTSILNEPIPVRLLHAALDELVKAQRQDRKLRAGLEQVLSKIRTRDGRAIGLGRSFHILGAITATGYATATPSRQIIWNPEMSLIALTQVDANKTMTIRELLLKTNLERNKP